MADDACPKCGQVLRQLGAESCPKCGLVFRKYRQVIAEAAQLREATIARRASAGEEQQSWLRHWLLYVPAEVPSWRVYGGAALLAASVYFGWRFYFMDIPEWEMAGTFFHGAMVPFHEFGHLLFMPFGEFMHLAGGSLAQWLMPLGFLALFTFKNRDNLAASLMLWWTGTQFIDLAPYAWDALRPQHVLLSGRTGDTGAHDYIDILGTLGLLHRAHEVAWVMHKFGLVLMIAAWTWGGYIIWRQFQNRVDFVRSC